MKISSTTFLRPVGIIVVQLMTTMSLLLTCLQVARNLGKTLRAFQPTIRELQVGLRFTSCSVIKESCMQCKSNSLHLGCIKGFQEHP
jgi:hypothetical protein